MTDDRLRCPVCLRTKCFRVELGPSQLMSLDVDGFDAEHLTLRCACGTAITVTPKQAPHSLALLHLDVAKRLDVADG